MGLFKPATNQSAFLKMGIQGFGGSGKTMTAAKVAIGLHKLMKSNKTVAFLDSETGSDFVKPMFDDAGVPLSSHKSRAFVDLMAATKEAEKEYFLLIIDSISHFWAELVKAYTAKREKKRLRVWDWGPIKEEWYQFTDLYVNSKVHIIMNGRAGWVYGDREDEEGVTETTKIGTKMKAETDMNYEPSLLVEMEKARPADAVAIGTNFVNRAWILKDRFDKINGKFFDRPTFETFLPHIKLLNLGGEHVGFETSTNSQELFEGPTSRIEFAKRREIALENIQNELLKRWPGQTIAEKKARLEMLEKCFLTASWTAISSKTVEELEGALLIIKEIPIEQKEKKDA